MNRRWFGAALAALLVAGVSAEARMHTPYRGHRIVPAGGGALDGFTSPSGAYSFRKLKSGYAGFSVKLRRVDTTTQDIGFVGSDFDKTSATAFCTTACTVDTWYDQSGNARDFVNLTVANQPTYVANCNGSLPCAQLTGSQLIALPVSWTPATQIQTLNVVGMRTVGSASGAILIKSNGNNARILGTTASLWSLSTGPINATASDGAWHSAVGVMVTTGGASVISIDGTETTGTTTPNLTAGTPGINAVASATISVTEAAFWDGYALTPADRTALTNNQRNYWMPLLDNIAGSTGAYSFRRLRTAYAGNAIQIRRTSDNALLDIGFAANGNLNEPAAVTHCAATTCFVAKIYDQSGLGLDLVTASNAAQPALTFSCMGNARTAACARFTLTAHQLLTAANVTPATGTVSLAMIAERASGTGLDRISRQTVGNYARFGGANVWSSIGEINVGGLSATATDGVQHAGIIIIDGVNSVTNIDGVDTLVPIPTPGAVGGVTPGQQGVTGVNSSVHNQIEAIFFDNVSLSLAQRQYISTSQLRWLGAN